ncbi:M20/M25/M40 family metallo-hydrolase [Nitriliruptor alkaliphilus]|uniref:M20/M25/M40 family metallo-hydrolase n=1 Tax=Nitriliruptor alkaliphilus TaxID=427918 RepID=UPI000697572F|nr:M20/M25/M40 family metallo-hydrolase [Nitriliruptor alkaliphilus]
MEGLELLASLVRIASVNPPGDGEGEVADLLREPLDAAGLDTEVLVSPQGRPSLIARLDGPTDRPPLVLLSHSDVVPVEEDRWTHDPFGGEVHDGQLWGRGSLDMKSVAVLHTQAAVALATGGATPEREVLVVLVADEEAGGAEGAEWLVDHHPVRVGFRDTAPPPEVLGEGGFGLAGVLDRPLMPIVVGEKSPLWLRASATGDAGHGSLPPADQAIAGLVRFITAVSGPRPARLHPVMRDQFAALAGVATGTQRRAFQLLAGPAGAAAVRVLAPRIRATSAVLGHLLADTVTPTQVRAGYKHNVVPGSAEVTFDARLLPDTDVDALLSWLSDVGERHGVTVAAEQRWSSPVSPRGDLFDLLTDVSAALPDGPLPVASLTPGVTDLRFFRRRGATAYGWVPLVLTPEQVATFHGADERVPVEQFERASTAMTDAVHRAATRPGT